MQVTDFSSVSARGVQMGSCRVGCGIKRAILLVGKEEKGEPMFLEARIAFPQ